MDLIKYENDPEKLKLELEFEIIGIYDEHFERDKQIILELYKDLFAKQKRPPSLKSMEIEVMEYNYQLCYKISELEFDENYKADAITALKKSLAIGMVDLDIYFESQISSMAIEMLNDYSWRYSLVISNCIRDSLQDAGAIYEDDDFGNPFFYDPLFDFAEQVIYVNNAQQVMFSDLYSEEYLYGKKGFVGHYENISNYVVERRPKTRPSTNPLLENDR